MAKRKVLRPGSVYSIRLSDGEYAFGQVCEGSDFAFFDLKQAEPLPPIEAILEHALAFRVPVAMDAPTAGRWRLMGIAELHGSLALRGIYRHRPVGSAQVFLYTAGRSVPAALDEVRDLEVLATWFSHHIEQRLEDYFSGQPSKYTQALNARDEEVLMATKSRGRS